MNHHTLKDLANEVAASCEILCSWLKQEGYPQPSFNEDGPASFPQSDARQTVQDARAKLIGAASDLSFLVRCYVTYFQTRDFSMLVFKLIDGTGTVARRCSSIFCE